MILASPIGGLDLALRKGSSASRSFASLLSRWGAALRDLLTIDRPQLDPLCCDLATKDVALQKALRRAAGTWGGHQASRPFSHLPRD